MDLHDQQLSYRRAALQDAGGQKSGTKAVKAAAT
jgi:hypothetical protein